jgi:glycerol-3-phosphate acyltransferase PlsY
MNYLTCILIGYFLGNINAAYIISKLKGFDIRTKGSNNAGASNATIIMGWKIGVTVAIIDILKAFLAVSIVKSLFPNLELAAIIAGTSCVIGHIFPILMRFRGGKGLASYIGMILAIDWRVFIVVGLIIILVTVISNYIALATLTTVTIYPIYLYFIKENIISIVILAIVAVIMYYKHISNIQRILSGTETGLRKIRK